MKAHAATASNLPSLHDCETLPPKPAPAPDFALGFPGKQALNSMFLRHSTQSGGSFQDSIQADLLGVNLKITLLYSPSKLLENPFTSPASEPCYKRGYKLKQTNEPFGVRVRALKWTSAHLVSLEWKRFYVWKQTRKVSGGKPQEPQSKDPAPTRRGKAKPRVSLAYGRSRPIDAAPASVSRLCPQSLSPPEGPQRCPAES